MEKILVIEDNETNMYLISFILKKTGYEVIEARNGNAGMDLLLKENPDLVIMDIQLPDIDGLEVTKRIRNLKGGKKIPIIALTSYALAGDREKALSAGCTGYIEKPINPENFIANIQSFLKDTGSGAKA